MATCTHAIETDTTLTQTSYVSGAFTPAAADLLLVFVTSNATVAVGTMTDSQGIGFTKVTSAVYEASINTIYLFVANGPAAASSMTVTFDCTGDAAGGNIIQVVRVSGMLKFGLDAILQTAKQENQAAAGTPAPAFAASAKTGNPTLGVVGLSDNPAAMTPPTSWTEQSDAGYNTPVTGAEYVTRNSGFTGTTITWGSATSAVFGDIIVELDTDPPLMSQGIM